jgi:hypothetical protein
LIIRREDVSFPYFGSRLDRHVMFRPFPTADWIVVAPGFPGLSTSGNTLVVNSNGWRLYRPKALS